MKRTRTAALALATAAAALAPVFVEAAAAEGSPYIQDPAGGEKTMKSLWTQDDQHKLEAQFRFHPGVTYAMKDRPGPAAAPEWNSETGDAETLAWRPTFEFAWAFSDSLVVKKAIRTKDGKHPVTLYAVLERADGTTAAEVRDETKDRPATGRTTLEGGRRIACDTGDYTVHWSVTRTGYGTLRGTLPWNADCEQYRKAFTTGQDPR
ncbi:hypothetical protein [Streptomyces sp. NPDC090022]|uniref:hypothetical protein n=1 Tax=Streptomyces sp. NPDC090022 TaxID=3365920 RepID=UPI00380E2F9A